jgi:hypothetical protein
MKRSLKDQFSTEIRSLFNGYPKFVYSKNQNDNLSGIPVFVSHTIEPELFEKQLQFLNKNGYKTLSIQEFYEIISKTKTITNNKFVLLTIDDARSSVWRFAFPLLKKYQIKATVFVIPGITEEGTSCRLNLEDYWNSKCKLKEVHDIDSSDNTLCNWAEIKAMYNTDYVNIESHTLFHRELFSNNKIIDYITQNTSFIPYKFTGSPYYSIENIGKPVLASEYLGLPLFESEPLMLAGAKMKVSPELVNKCKGIYHDASINKEDWKSKINNFINDHSNNEKYFKLETNSEQDVTDDLRIAREIIQRQLDNKAGNHLCLPWNLGNMKTVEICKKLEIKSCFWGVLANKNINKPGDDPYFISRIKNDFIFRLPGDGRESLYSIYKYKIKRRFSGEKIF